MFAPPAANQRGAAFLPVFPALSPLGSGLFFWHHPSNPGARIIEMSFYLDIYTVIQVWYSLNFFEVQEFRGLFFILKAELSKRPIYINIFAAWNKLFHFFSPIREKLITFAAELYNTFKVKHFL
ncbi:MAG: hypothetical protein J6Z14_09475 [Prevotella sp.]|nr:hypothetical protein [Prevotella sp.]